LPFLPLYVQELGVADIGEVALWSGVIFTASPLLSAVVAPLWGMLADRYGYKLMIQKALLVFIVTVALMGFVESALQLLALRIMQGLLGGFGPLALTMVSVTSPKTKLGSAMGVMQSAKIMSIVTGPAIGGVLAQFTGLRSLFFVASVTSLIAFILVGLGYKESPPSSLVDAPTNARSWRASLHEIYRQPWLRVLIILGFVISFIDWSYRPVIPIYINSLSSSGVSVPVMVGLITSVGAIFAAVSSQWLGRQSEKRRPEDLLVLGLIAGALFCAPLSLVQNNWQLLGLWALLNLLTGGILTLIFTLSGELIPEEWMGTGFGVLTVAAQGGKGFAPMISGVLGSINLHSVFIVNSVAYVGLALIVVWARKNYKHVSDS